MSLYEKKKLPVGIESFEELRREGFYYVDKTAMIRDLLCSVIGREALRFSFLLESGRLMEQEKEMYRKLICVSPESLNNFVMADDVLMSSLQTLSMLLCRHFEKKVILLIDEYDVPLAKANG